MDGCNAGSLNIWIAFDCLCYCLEDGGRGFDAGTGRIGVGSVLVGGELVKARYLKILVRFESANSLSAS